MCYGQRERRRHCCVDCIPAFGQYRRTGVARSRGGADDDAIFPVDTKILHRRTSRCDGDEKDSDEKMNAHENLSHVETIEEAYNDRATARELNLPARATERIF
jgi:hypothetical protein